MNSRIKKWIVALLGLIALGTPSTTVHVDDIRRDQWHLRFLRVREVHNLSLGAGVRVAVIDTGIDSHPDLRKNLLPGADLVSGSGDGRADEDSHGTSMGGIIAAHGTGTDMGALGLAPEAMLLPVRYRRASRNTESGDLAAGIQWAVEHGASVINISGGGSPSARLRQAIRAAIAADVVVVAAAGNQPSAQSVGFPAALEGVVAVGATDRNGSHAAVSVTGKQIAISAPGVDIYSTSINGKYSKATGTSASTAIVAGAAALVRSKYPELSAREVVHRLTATATDKGTPGRDQQYGYGVLDLVAALTADVPPLTASTGPTATPPSQEGGNSDDGSDGLVIAITATIAAVLSVAALVRLRRWRRTSDG